ncbi:F0F1 ATP synthase subunit epsilon [Desulfosarcina ovata subsp. sediminis]|uniref:F0F1 ATP synthase subunit epsilon n=1 Tax=Desulfosarcina ovata subsp. sediminis TaxID=885957 RepID=A0A5K8A0E8_9BACT|nr:F0F1 ATP synthase subunit epsilon [Desulfosarcina ovata]BBO85810.1 F0F1 ATP synthase subunit epsilon [Desulfosarcina ovata subsp. sediminis]
MKLTVFQPETVCLDESVTKVVAQGPEGAFGLRPRHLDMAAALSPGILAYWTPDGAEHFLAVNGGILVKQGETVQVATQMAVPGELGAIQAAVRRFVTDMDDRERQTRAVVARLEADFIRRFVEFGKNA